MQASGIQVLFEPNIINRLLEGLSVTLSIALTSMAISLVLGLILGVVMTSKNWLVQLVTRIYLEIVRIMPQLVLIFLIFFGLARAFQLDLSGELSAILAFSFWGTAEMGDLVRSAIQAIPRHQYESGAALGLSPRQCQLYIIIPQTLRRLLPSTINLLTRMVKTSSIVVLIGVVEVTEVGKQIIDAYRFTYDDTAFWIYGAIFILYFIVCWPFSQLAQYLDKKINREV